MRMAERIKAPAGSKAVERTYARTCCCCFASASPRQRARNPTVLSPQTLAQRRGTGLELVARSSALKGVPEIYPIDGFEYETDHEYSQLANWLVPGRVLVGRYPYVEPSRCVQREIGEQQLQQLLEVGVRTFVCLQAELPPQKEMTIGGQGSGFLPYAPVASMLASTMEAPPDIGMNAGIRNGHLDQFLPQRRKSASNDAERSENGSAGLTFLHCPIPDLGVPTTEQVHKLLADLIPRLQKREMLYIHCWGGRGRAGMIGACLLAAVYGIHGDEALRRVQKAFNTRGDDVGRWSPETMEQREFVRKFVSELRNQD